MGKGGKFLLGEESPAKLQGKYVGLLYFFGWPVDTGGCHLFHENQRNLLWFFKINRDPGSL